jgi:hypothetical protein
VRLLVTFDSISSSLLVEGACRKRRLPCSLIPVPRSLTASCGYAAEVAAEEAGEVLGLLRELKAEWKAVYQPEGKTYRSLYRYEGEGGEARV